MFYLIETFDKLNRREDILSASNVWIIVDQRIYKLNPKSINYILGINQFLFRKRLKAQTAGKKWDEWFLLLDMVTVEGTEHEDFRGILIK